MTLTLGVAYLTVLAHERNRRAQADNLRLQSRVLTSLLDPTPIPPPQSRADLALEERSTLLEAAKDRWNEELEGVVRRVQRTDWNGVREGLEGAVSRLLGTGFEKSREGIEEVENQAGPKVQEAVDRSRDTARRGVDEATGGNNRASAEVKVGASKIAAAAKAKADEVASSTRKEVTAGELKASELGSVAKSKADQVSAEAARHSGGTVDAARGAVRDAVHRGLEYGKEAVGKAQAAVGLATEKIETKGQSSVLSHSSAVEKPEPLNKSVEEALEERYKPIDERDNNVLRGV